MAITDVFKSAVSTGDIRGIRIMMKDSLLVDTTFDEFNKMNNLARNVNGLYEAHDGRDINKDISAWNDGYMNKLMVQVVGNFSHERVDHLMQVVRHLRPIAASPPQQDASARQTPPSPSIQLQGSNYQEQKRQDERSGRITTYRSAKIATGAVAGGIVGGAVAGVASVPVLAGATVGAVVVGTVVAVATKED